MKPKLLPNSSKKTVEKYKSIFLVSIKTSNDRDIAPMYWIPKFNKNPYQQPYKDGSTNCTTKPLS